MKVQVDGEDVFELNETKCKVICNDILEEEFVEDMKRRAKYIWEHKYERCFERLKKEWEPKLKDNGVDAIPLNADAFAELVFAQPNYKSRSAREKEDKEKNK